MSDIADKLRDAKEAADALLWEPNRTDLREPLRKALAEFPDPDAVGEFLGAAKALRHCFLPGEQRTRFDEGLVELFDTALAKLEEKP